MLQHMCICKNGFWVITQKHMHYQPDIFPHWYIYRKHLCNRIACWTVQLEKEGAEETLKESDEPQCLGKGFSQRLHRWWRNRFQTNIHAIARTCLRFALYTYGARVWHRYGYVQVNYNMVSPIFIVFFFLLFLLLNSSRHTVMQPNMAMPIVHLSLPLTTSHSHPHPTSK